MESTDNISIHPFRMTRTIRNMSLATGKKVTTLQHFKGVTLNLHSWINWKIKTSPWSRLWAMEKPLQPPLNPVLSTRYLVAYSCSSSSTKTTVSSCFGKWRSQNFFGKPCCIKVSQSKTIAPSDESRLELVGSTEPTASISDYIYACEKDISTYIKSKTLADSKSWIRH